MLVRADLLLFPSFPLSYLLLAVQTLLHSDFRVILAYATPLKGNHDTSGLFGRAPAPAPPAAPAEALSNTLEVERLHTVACEKVKHQLCLREGGAGGVTKTSSSSGSTFLQGAGTLPNTDPSSSSYPYLIGLKYGLKEMDRKCSCANN